MLVYFACLLACIMDRYFAYFCLLASFPLLPFLKPLIAAAPLFPLPRYALVLYYLRYLVSREILWCFREGNRYTTVKTRRDIYNQIA